MASAIPNDVFRALMSGELDLHTSGDDIRLMLLMTNTTADTQVDAVPNPADYTTLDECDDTSYARQALASEAVTADDTDDEGVFDATDASFTSLDGNSTRDIQGALLYKHVDGTDANDINIAFIDFTSDIPSTATQIDVPFASEGILNMAQG